MYHVHPKEPLRWSTKNPDPDAAIDTFVCNGATRQVGGRAHCVEYERYLLELEATDD